jgi:hypothetical protein
MPRRQLALSYTDVDINHSGGNMKNKRFTIVGIYRDNNQRYATAGYGPTVTDAVISAIKTCWRENDDLDMDLEVCAAFRGSQPIQDRTVEDASKRMPAVRCRAKHNHKFTVVTDSKVDHVRARNAYWAEPGDGPRVAGIFRGHLKCWLTDVDWDRVDAETAVLKQAA